MLSSPLSLKYRIAIIIFLLEAVMMTFVLGASLAEYRDANREQARINEQVLMSLLSDLSRIALFTAEYDELQPYMELVVDDPRVDRVMLLDHQNRVVVSSEVSDVGTDAAHFEAGHDQYWRTQEISNPSGLLGTLAINFSDSPLLAANHKALDAGIEIALIGMITIAIIGVLIGFYLTRRLDRLTSAAQRMADGDLGVMVDIKGRDEVALLGQAFDRMARHVETYIDDLQASQHQLREAHNGLERRIETRTRELAIARDQALEASRTKSMFLANMSHELRTPLNAIIGYSEMLEEEAREENLLNFAPDLKKIGDAGLHLLHLINDILDLSKIEAGKMELTLEDFVIRDVLEEVLATTKPLIEKNGNRFHLHCEAELGEMHADPTKLKQVLINLVANAAKFTQDGEISLHAGRKEKGGEGYVCFQIRDTGIGISDEHMHKLFTEFSQADSSTTREYGGTGLGLAISRRFCNLMGGEISVESELHKGTVFSILLPLQVTSDIPYSHEKKNERLAFGDAARRRGSAPGQERRKRTPKILVVDDDRHACDQLHRYLLKQGFEVFIAHSGEEGLAMARQVKPDIITLDVMVPGLDGWGMLRHIDADAELADIAVMVVTTCQDKDKVQDLGARWVLPKPADAAAVVEVIQQSLRGQPGIESWAEASPATAQERREEI